MSTPFSAGLLAIGPTGAVRIVAAIEPLDASSTLKSALFLWKTGFGRVHDSDRVGEGQDRH
ncbi:hypothetical protein JZ751_029753 [Albula glossodonta]|uniref:Uncharacterized protein n=1 Tax=Albula glossodonta TaxID=121402 RepID=A0A8T2MUT8_9TELE|nr:hypothetical protein JZ751_029753 [Albula glossodonta]